MVTKLISTPTGIKKPNNSGITQTIKQQIPLREKLQIAKTQRVTTQSEAITQQVTETQRVIARARTISITETQHTGEDGAQRAEDGGQKGGEDG